VNVKVVLVDDQALIRTGFKMILESEDDIEVVGEAGDGEQAISIARAMKPDVVLMDVQMPRMDGLEATGRIARDAGMRSRIIILTTFERDDYVFEALRAGASGFLLKNSPPEELVRAVRVVAGGEALLSPSVTKKVIERFVGRPANRSNEVELGFLTERETEILRLLATGKSNAELAAFLFVGEGTIKTHVSHVLTKLGLRDRMQAVIFAYESGLIETGQHRE
jgi:DNA-binding NarL/FixJ family response regulator